MKTSPLRSFRQELRLTLVLWLNFKNRGGSGPVPVRGFQVVSDMILLCFLDSPWQGSKALERLNEKAVAVFAGSNAGP